MVFSCHACTVNRSEGTSLSKGTYLEDSLAHGVPSDAQIAKCISLIEDMQMNFEQLVRAMGSEATESAFVIGVTGSPGVGKSSFLNALLPYIKEGYGKVAILAIDPSSHLSGGAILGDRIRITESNFGEELFFRSLATRGTYGGLSSVTATVVQFLSKCGFETVVIETVGVGQNEIEIVKIANVVIHVIDSTAGDEIQLDKSGIMEIGDIYFVNKGDITNPSKFIANLRASLHGEFRKNGIVPTVIAGSAKKGDGILETVSKINEYAVLEHKLDSGRPLT